MVVLFVQVNILGFNVYKCREIVIYVKTNYLLQKTRNELLEVNSPAYMVGLTARYWFVGNVMVITISWFVQKEVKLFSRLPRMLMMFKLDR